MLQPIFTVIDEQGVRFKNFIESVEVQKFPVAWQIIDVEAVTFMPPFGL